MRVLLITIIASIVIVSACNAKDTALSPENSITKEQDDSMASNAENSALPVRNGNANAGGRLQIEIIYTDLTEDKCVDAETDEEEEWSIQTCKGVGGYKLLVSEGDLRQTIDVIAPDERKYELNLWQVVSSAFSTVGDKAEWRVISENGKISPIALIVRYNVNEDPENTEKITSYLTVSKITPAMACVTDIVKPMRNANEKARSLADNSSSRPCLGMITPTE